MEHTRKIVEVDKYEGGYRNVLVLFKIIFFLLQDGCKTDRYNVAVLSCVILVAARAASIQ